MREHTVKAFEQELILLDKRVTQMGGLAEQLLGRAFDALERRDPKLAAEVVSDDSQIDQLERELQDQSIVMIAKRQPLADDLRHIMTVLKIAGDLERIGDLAKNIAKRALAISGENHPKPLMTGLKNMTEPALHQLKDVLEAYSERQADKALAATNPIELTPWVIETRRVAIPLDNAGYRQARAAGMLTRPAFRWTGSGDERGELLPAASADDARQAIESEVAYLRLGTLHVAAIPGEIYPEFVYGQFQDPVDPGADFLDAPLEPHVTGLLPAGKPFLLLGLANDEVAVVARRGAKANAPLVFSIVGRQGMPLGEATLRNTLDPAFEVKAGLAPSDVRVVVNVTRLLERI